MSSSDSVTSTGDSKPVSSATPSSSSDSIPVSSSGNCIPVSSDTPYSPSDFIPVSASDDESSSGSNTSAPIDKKRRKIDDNNQSDDSCETNRDHSSKSLEVSSASVGGAHDSVLQRSSSDFDGHTNSPKSSHSSEQVKSLETDSSVENRELGESSRESIIAINKTNTDRTKNQDLSVDKLEEISKKSAYELAISHDWKPLEDLLNYEIDESLSLSSHTTESIAGTKSSDYESISPNTSHSFVDSDTSKSNVSMPIIRDTESGSEQSFRCDKCEPIVCFESSDALKTHVEHIHGITQ